MRENFLFFFAFYRSFFRREFYHDNVAVKCYFMNFLCNTFSGRTFQFSYTLLVFLINLTAMSQQPNQRNKVNQSGQSCSKYTQAAVTSLAKFHFCHSILPNTNSSIAGEGTNNGSFEIKKTKGGPSRRRPHGKNYKRCLYFFLDWI